MADNEMGKAEFETRLWAALDEVRIGMLGAVGATPRHMQPMSGFGEPSTRTIWFFMQRDNDLIAQAAEAGGAAMFCLVSKDRNLWACIGGTLSQDRDPAMVDKYWGAVTAAWFPDGKDSPNLALMRLDMTDAQVWVVEGGGLKFAYEIAKANLTKTEPDVGAKTELQFT